MVPGAREDPAYILEVLESNKRAVRPKRVMTSDFFFYIVENADIHGRWSLGIQ